MPAFDLNASLGALRRQNAGGAVKTAEDLARYAAVIAQSGPAVVVECGTYEGGSARWFADRGLDVITIDIRPPGFVPEPGVTGIFGDSIDPDIVAKAAELTDGRRTMVVLDSDHHVNHVAAEIELYGPLVSPGCYLVVEDGIVDFIPVGGIDGYAPYAGPMTAVRELLVDNPNWEWAEDIEAMSPVSMSPMGWWRRAH
jgi:cephalosporin hydroxylase